MEDLPEMIANGASSLGSRNTTREPVVMPRRSASERVISRFTGMGKRVPSAKRSVSTTLRVANISCLNQHSRATSPIIIPFIQKSFQWTKTTIDDEFKVTQLALFKSQPLLQNIMSKPRKVLPPELIGTPKNGATSGRDEVITSVKINSGSFLASASS
jgi:hypothetical protein